MEKTVHVLIGGEVLCGFSDERPGDWPEGNVWVGIKDLALATCPSCQKRGEAYLEN